MVKYITETLTSDMIAEVRTYVRGYLGYLLDEGFDLRVTPTFKGSGCCIDFSSTYEVRYGIPYEWGDIKDIFIPFLIKLKSDYDIEYINKTYEHLQPDNPTHSGTFSINSLNIDSLITDGTLFNDSKMARILINVYFKND